MKMDTELQIFTLNCWGLIGVSRHRKERMTAIAAHLADKKYDFVFLQEVWCKKDYYMIRRKTSQVYPHAYYFHSGVLGSGVCILSQSSILDVAVCKFNLNGYPHRILHGDWFGGKVVGLCKVFYHGLKINLYVTHLHAEYDAFRDFYLPHRISQAFEMSQFVRLTSETADLSIIAGDFNTEPCDLPYRLIVHNGGCVDSLLMCPSIKSDAVVCATCGHPDNLYTSRKELQECPTGKRIDYVMYKCGAGTTVSVTSYSTPLGKIPGNSVPYSDHEAVVASLRVSKSADAPVVEPHTDSYARLEAITSAHTLLAAYLKKINTDRLRYLVLLSFILIVLFFSVFFRCYSGIASLLVVVQILSSMAIAYVLWMMFIVDKIEYNTLISTCKSMSLLRYAISKQLGVENDDSEKIQMFHVMKSICEPYKNEGAICVSTEEFKEFSLHPTVMLPIKKHCTYSVYNITPIFHDDLSENAVFCC